MTSYDNVEVWIRYFRDCRADFHDVKFIDDWDKLVIDKFWDIAFIDHEPYERRKVEAKRLSNNAKYLILHDSDPESEPLHKYSEIYPFFKYHFDYTLAKPYTTVLSNFVDLKNLKI